MVGRAEPHNLRLVHPSQDRVLTMRENARCQVRATGARLLFPAFFLSLHYFPSFFLSFCLSLSLSFFVRSGFQICWCTVPPLLGPAVVLTLCEQAGELRVMYELRWLTLIPAVFVFQVLLFLPFFQL